MKRFNKAIAAALRPTPERDPDEIQTHEENGARGGELHFELRYSAPITGQVAL